MKQEALEELKGLSGIIEINLTDDELTVLSKNAQQALQDVLFVLSKHSVKVKKLFIKEPDLESLFLYLTGNKLRD